MRRIIVTGPRHIKPVLIDSCDYELFRSHNNWTLTDDNRGHLYVRTSDRSALFLHKLILGVSSDQVDHIDGNTLDNRRKNLRVATASQNSRNKISVCGTSQYKGVSWVESRQRWIACICVNHANKTLGYFKNEQAAALAYNNAASRYFGEFARLNDLAS